MQKILTFSFFPCSCDDNKYTLEYLLKLSARKKQKEEAEEARAKEEEEGQEEETPANPFSAPAKRKRSTAQKQTA